MTTIPTDVKSGYRSSRDGSKIKAELSTGVASACIDLNYHEIYNIRNDFSIYTAESIAISKALDVAIINPFHVFPIFSDSLSILQALSSNSIVSVIQNNLGELYQLKYCSLPILSLYYNLRYTLRYCV